MADARGGEWGCGAESAGSPNGYSELEECFWGWGEFGAVWDV